MAAVRFFLYYIFLAGFGVADTAFASQSSLTLPAFPRPALVQEYGLDVEITPVRLLREFHRGGVRGMPDLETVDADYALLRRDSIGLLAAWLEEACRAVGYDLSQARTQVYDGNVLVRLLSTASGIAMLQQRNSQLALPIGTLLCERSEAWGNLPADGAKDVYVLFATDMGLMIYDPPTRQFASLAEFPNRQRILRVRF